MNKKTTFQTIVEDLTPEQKRELREANFPEWIKSLREVTSDPDFWAAMFLALVQGIAEGYAEATDYTKNNK